MIKGRFFEVYDCEVGVILNSGSGTLQGRLYIHMDLSNADEPIQLLTETASVLTDLAGDEDVNYNNTSYDLELATFEKITGASGSGGASTLQRSTEYFKGDFMTCKTAPGRVTLYCSTPGVTAAAEPVEYAGIADVGDRVTDAPACSPPAMWWARSMCRRTCSQTPRPASPVWRTASRSCGRS